MTTLYSFCSQPQGLVCPTETAQVGWCRPRNGDFYGTTSQGGTNSGSGTVFKITPGGTLTTLYRFCGQFPCINGSAPNSLALAASGNLYGTTLWGGPTGNSCNGDCGTIFKITPSGTFTTLYSFCSTSDCIDGLYPQGLVQSTNGIFYGITENGGANGSGEVFAFSSGEAPFVSTRPTIGIVGESSQLSATDWRASPASRLTAHRPQFSTTRHR